MVTWILSFFAAAFANVSSIKQRSAAVGHPYALKAKDIFLFLSLRPSRLALCVR